MPTTKTYDPAHAKAVADFVLELALLKFDCGSGYEGRYHRGLDLVHLRYLGTHVTTVEIWRDGAYMGWRQIGSFDSARLAIEAVRRLVPLPPP